MSGYYSTEVERQMKQESYEKHLLRLSTVKPFVDCTPPKACQRSALYNKPTQIDPIFPMRPSQAVNYNDALRHVDISTRLAQKCVNVKPFVQSVQQPKRNIVADYYNAKSSKKAADVKLMSESVRKYEMSGDDIQEQTKVHVKNLAESIRGQKLTQEKQIQTLYTNFYFSKLKNTNIHVILLSIVESAKQFKVNDPTFELEKKLTAMGVDLYCNSLE